MSTKFLVLIGMDYGTTRREPGDVVSDIPKQSIPWLLEQGAITAQLDAPVVAPEVTPEVTPEVEPAAPAAEVE